MLLSFFIFPLVDHFWFPQRDPQPDPLGHLCDTLPSAATPKHTSLAELGQVVVNARNNFQKVTFLLGAGASFHNGKPTGIPLGGMLLKQFEDSILSRLVKHGSLPGHYRTNPEWNKIKHKHVGATYFDLADQCFPSAEERNKFFRNLVAGKHPDAGHKVLAELSMEFPEVFDLAMTTNFDNFISAAFPNADHPADYAHAAEPPPKCATRVASTFSSGIRLRNAENELVPGTLHGLLQRSAEKGSFCVWHVHGAADLSLGEPLNTWDEVCGRSQGNEIGVELPTLPCPSHPCPFLFSFHPRHRFVTRTKHSWRAWTGLTVSSFALATLATTPG